MTDREKLVTYLEENEDDTGARLAFSDWLEEHNESEEAERQRQWPAARDWMIAFAEKNGGYCPGYHREDYELWAPHTYKDIVKIATHYVDSGFDDEFVQMGSERLRDAMWDKDTAAKFWECWSILTGRPAPPEEVTDERIDWTHKTNPFSCSC